MYVGTIIGTNTVLYYTILIIIHSKHIISYLIEKTEFIL